MPSKKLQRHHAMMWEVEKINRVDNLLRWYMQVNDAEIVLQTVSNKGDAAKKRI